jgi:hypothetical protein
MSPQAFCELYATLDELLDFSRVDVGEDGHALEILAFIRGLPVLGHWLGGAIIAYDGGSRIIVVDNRKPGGHWAICREALEPVGKGG